MAIDVWSLFVKIPRVMSNFTFDLDIGTLDRFLAILLLIDLHVPRQEICWEKSLTFTMLLASEVMSGNKFHEILFNLQVAGNDNCQKQIYSEKLGVFSICLN